MEILRAKTKELFKSELSPAQRANSALNIAEMEVGKTVLESYPRRIVLEMTSACNIKCVFCGRDEAEFRQTYLKLEVLDKLQDALAHCEEVTLFGWGEPTINPQFRGFLEALSHTPVRKYFVTNGTRLEKFIDDIFRFKVDIIAISLDGASAAVNDRIRVGASFEKIIANIRAIKERQSALGVDFPYINFVFVAMRSNIRDLPKMLNLAKDLGIQEVKVVFLSAFSTEMLNEVLYDQQDVVREVFSEAANLAARLGIKLKLPYIQGEDIAQNRQHKDCFVGWRDFFIGSDDSIRPCQSSSQKLGRFSAFVTFKDAWNSPAMQEFRKSVNDWGEDSDAMIAGGGQREIAATSPRIHTANLSGKSHGKSTGGGDTSLAPSDCSRVAAPPQRPKTTMPLPCQLCYQSSHANFNRKSSFIQVGNAFAPDWEKRKN